MKKLLLLLFLISLLPLESAAAAYATVNGVKYRYDIVSRTATVYEWSSIATIAKIPTSIQITASGKTSSYHVSGISSGAFKNCKSLTEIILPESFTQIDARAFANASALTTITIPKTITSIESGAFEGCISLTTLTIPETVTSIGSGAFEGCVNLANITLPNTIQTIESSMFKGCTSLTSIIIPNSVTKLNSECFSNTGFSTFNIPPTIKDMGYSVFEGCKNLTSVTFPESITAIQSYTFRDCTALKEFKTPQKLNTIFSFAFSGCSSLTEINDPAYYIYYNAFENCTGLKKATVSDASKSMFKGCTALESVMIHDKDVPESMFEGCKNLKSVSILNPSGGVIGNRAFYGCESLTSAPLPNGIISIENYAFSGCSKITKIDLPKSIKSVGTIAFESAEGLIIKINPALAQTGSSSAPYYFLSSANPTKVYAHKIDKDKIETYYKGEVIYFEDMDIASHKTFLARIDFSVNTSSENLSFPIKKISYAPYGKLNESKTIQPNEGNNYSITGLQPDETYYILIDDKSGEHNYVYKTALPNVSSTYYPDGTTQTHLRVLVTATADESISPKCYVLGNECENKTPTTIKGLKPGTNYEIQGYADYNGKTFYSKSYNKISTLGMNPKLTCKATPTKLIFEGSWSEGDATVEKFGFTTYLNSTNFDGKMTKIISGLEPGQSREEFFGVKVSENYTPYSTSLKATTPQVTWSEGDFTATSLKSVRLRVATNCDAETGTGIEWRRNDAPDNIKSTYVACPVVDGILVGSLRNLNPEVYYKFRPVYESASGNKYYGEWTGFYSGDASVYFDPEVRTLEDIEIFENSALVASYVMPGSYDIRRQGVQYWHKNIASGRANEEKLEITTTGIKSTVTLPNLQPGTEYTYRAFAETESGIIYGEEKSFTTKGTSGINDVIFNKQEALVVKLKENPTSGPIEIAINGTSSEKVEATIINMSGSLIYSGTLPTSNEWSAIETPLIPGIYILTVTDGKQHASVRVIATN